MADYRGHDGKVHNVNAEFQATANVIKQICKDRRS